MRAIAHNAGHSLDFRGISRERMIDASIRASSGDRAMMHRMFVECTDRKAVARVLEAARGLEGAGFKWNDHYLAATVPGQTYEGVFVGQGANHFTFRTTTDILVGDKRDMPAGVNAKDAVSFTAGDHDNSGQTRSEGLSRPGSSRPTGGGRGRRR